MLLISPFLLRKAPTPNNDFQVFEKLTKAVNLQHGVISEVPNVIDDLSGNPHVFVARVKQSSGKNAYALWIYEETQSAFALWQITHDNGIQLCGLVRANDAMQPDLETAFDAQAGQFFGLTVPTQAINKIRANYSV